MNQNIILSIKDHRQYLPKSEQKIADYILENTAEVINLNAQELAKKAGSSPAAIIRFCHSIEVNGFTDLKLLLSANLGQTSVAMYTEVEDGETTAAIKEKLQLRTIHVLERTGERLVDESVDAAVASIEKSELIFVYGVGASSLVAQDVHQKFSRLGRMVFTSLDHHLIASTMGTTPLTSVFIAISNSGENRETNALVKIAQDRKMTVIGITENEVSTLGKASDILLLSSKGEEAPLRSAATVSLTAQLFIVDVLLFAYATKNYDDTLKKIKYSKAAVEELKSNQLK
ncbi:MurR/RpiR family transcriptional regulator [Enterococcus rivorum]|uniref:RpiR family transcriptional regulator n=1 Tax=Enterococcus rivorum TaxID=762845 RepID=A0A1E5KW36_9ENTE|nr:MurR/RpiR family transcriptional regulator [Enterococcus rivorum]MBP2100128.1 DNA-binding MurR/RpiR family transcriptional regulator [Enterococcus rivorum]OEH82082.1 RpiR family transcriptional regulator [Enterococcus rivorum]